MQPINLSDNTQTRNYSSMSSKNNFERKTSWSFFNFLLFTITLLLSFEFITAESELSIFDKHDDEIANDSLRSMNYINHFFLSSIGAILATSVGNQLQLNPIYSLGASLVLSAKSSLASTVADTSHDSLALEADDKRANLPGKNIQPSGCINIYPGINSTITTLHRPSILQNPFPWFWVGTKQDCGDNPGFRIELISNQTNTFTPGQISTGCGAGYSIDSNGTRYRSNCHPAYRDLKPRVRGFWYIQPITLLENNTSLAYHITVNVYQGKDSWTNLASTTGYNYSLVKTTATIDNVFLHQRPRQKFYPFSDVKIFGPILDNENIHVVPTPTLPILNKNLPDYCLSSGSATGINLPWQNGPAGIVNCSHLLEAQYNRTEKITFPLRYALKSSTPTSSDIFVLEKMVNIKPFNIEAIQNTTFYYRKGYSFNPFTYQDPLEVNEIFRNETFNITTLNNINFNHSNYNYWHPIPNGLSTLGNALNPTQTKLAFTILAISSLDSSVNLLINLTDSNHFSVANTNMMFRSGQTSFDLETLITLSRSGSTRITNGQRPAVKGDAGLLPGEILQFTGSVTPYFKSENCQFEIGQSDSGIAIHGPHSLASLNACFNNMVISNPPRDLFSVFQTLHLQGNIIHLKSGKSIEKFSIDFQHSTEEYLVAFYTILTILISALAFFIKSEYKPAKQFIVKKLCATHPYGDSLHERVAFLLQTPRDLYKEKRLAFQQAINTFKSYSQDNIDNADIDKADENFPYKLAIAMRSSLQSHFVAMKNQRRNKFEKLIEWILLKFRDPKPWLEEITFLIEQEIANVESYHNVNNSLITTMVDDLQNVKVDDEIYKILMKAKDIFDQDDGKKVSFNKARKSMVPPGFLARVLYALVQQCTGLWENRPHVSCPSFGNCCGFFAKKQNKLIDPNQQELSQKDFDYQQLKNL